MVRKKKENGDDSTADGDDNDDNRIVTIKCLLNSILRDDSRELFIKSMEIKSLNATKMCVLGSLLFLYKVQYSFEVGMGDDDFFDGDGEKAINSCFLGVLEQNIEKEKAVWPKHWTNNINSHGQQTNIGAM